MDFSQGLTVYAFLLSFFMGLISFVSPCILPLIPSYLSYITGITYDELVDSASLGRNRDRMLLHSCLFVAGFSTIFVLLGATASMLGAVLWRHLDSIRIVGGIVIILMGFFVLDVVNIPFLRREAKLRLKTRPMGHAGTFVVGMVFGAGWTPCTGPFLGSVFALAMETDTAGRGMALLAFYSLGLGIPFILSSLAITAFLSSYCRLQRHLRLVKTASGVVLIIMGALLIMDKLTVLVPKGF